MADNIIRTEDLFSLGQESESQNSTLIEGENIIKTEELFSLGKTTDPASGTDSGSESGLLGSVQDRTVQPNIVIPEIDSDAPLSSGDFYSIINEEKEEIKVDDKKEYTIPEAFKLTKEAKDKDTETLEAWLNEEYFGKGVASQAMGTDNITAYQINDPTLGDLKQDFKSNLGELGISRAAFENLSDSDLDDIFTNVFSAQVRTAQAKEGEADERTKINDILLKKEKDQTDAGAIEVGVDKLDNAKINSYENKLEAEFAQNVKKLRGELTEEERERVENYLDPEFPGSLGDRLFNKDETIQVKTFDGFETRRTGKRVSKDEKYEIYHNPTSGRNIKKTEARAIENNGGTTVNITDAYETYLASFKNTSQDDLAKYNNRLLLEESGYNIENKEVGNYYVGDKTMRNLLLKQGYESDKQGVFQDVPLGVLTQLSHVPGTWDFWSTDSYMSKGEIIPQDFENKPYENEEEFVEFLQTRRKQGNDIAAKNAALKQVYYLNRDPSTISKNRVGQFGGAFAQSLLGETITAEQTPITNQKIIDVIGNQIIPESGADITLQQEEIFERTFADEATEAAGGLAAMLTVLSPINKVQKALGINRMIAGLSAPRYVKGGKSITQSKAIKEAAKAGDDLAGWAKGAGYTEVAASSLQKGIGLATLGVYEDFKMREVLGAVTDGRMEFERGVGFGFAIAPKVLPYGFGRFGRGKKYDLTHSRNQLNTFMQSTFVNAPSFALAVEGGDALGAVVKDIQGKEEYETWAKHHWSDRNTNMRRIGLNLITGKALGLVHFNAMDFKTTENIGKFQRQSVEFIAKDYDVIDNLAGGTKNRDKFIAENPNSKEVQNLQKHWEDFNLATQRLDMINSSAEWTDPAKAKKTYENHYKPLAELFKSKGKEIKIEVTDKPIYQEIVKNGKVVKQEVSALYTRLNDGPNKGVATIQINTKKAKGKQYANHEGLHAYLDLMFDGNIKMKEQFTNSFKEALKSIKTPNSNLYQDILKTKDIKEIDKLEEMMAYSAEYLGKAEYYNTLVSNQAFTKVKKFWNNFAESTLGHKADLTLKQDIIDLLGTYGKTGDIKKLEKLNEIIEYDPTGKAREGQMATTDINKTVEQIKTRKTDVLQEIKDLRTAKPKGYENIIKEKTELFNELNANQRKLENKVEIEKVDVAKEGWKNQVDKSYTGTYKTKEEFQRSSEYGKVSSDILNSSGLENTIRQAATKMGIADAAKNDFVSDVKDRVLERFLKNYNPGVINKKYGRALTPFEYITTRPPKGESIIYRSAGDVAGKYKKQVKTIASDAYEGGYGAFEGYSEQTGHMNTSKTFDSKVEREGIELSEQEGMQKKIGDKTLGEIIDQKSGADAKNLDFEAKKAKEIVSYKNIQSNAERTIGKEIAVDHYGMSPEMYSKTLKSKSQWLNNKDIENILDVIKSDVEADLNMMPRWKQSIIDPITGKEVAFDVVGGKFPSEPKATGTTTSVLKLTDASGKPLIYEPIPQAGTKGTKYKFTTRYEKYLETADQAFKTEFEQDIVEALSRGNKAEISGKLKGWIMQRKKAMYVQGVDKALPNTPELNNRFAFAEMSNQITAGKNPKLATLGELVNEVRKNIDSNFMPSLSSFQTLFKGRNFDKYRKNGNIDLFMDQWNKIESRIHGFEKSIEKQAEIMYEGRTIERSELEAIEAKNFKDMAGKLKEQGGVFKNINTGEGLYSWSKDPMAVAKQNIFEAALGNKYPAGKEGLVLTALGNGKNKRWNPVTEKMELISYPKGYEKTISNWFETRLGEKWTGNGKTTKDKGFEWMEEVVIKDTGDVKTKLANENLAAKNAGKTEAERIEIIHKEATKMMSGKTGDFNTVLEANKKLRLFHLNSIKDIIDNHAKYGLTKTEAIQAALRHVRHQTDITNGPIKGTATITAATIEVGIPVGKNEAAKNYLGTMYHAEHQMQLMNHSYTFFNSIGKNKGNKKGFKNDMEKLANLFEQSITVKQDQLIYDSPLFGGNTTYLKAFKGKNLGEVSSILNIMYRPGVASTMVDLKSKTPQTIAETILKNYNKRQLDILLKESAKLGEPNSLHYDLRLKNNTRNIEIQNRDVLNRSIGKKMAKTVASKDINKVIKIVDKALENGRRKYKKTQGMSTFDFDETVGVSENFVIATKGGKTKRIASDQWPVVGDKMVKEGWKMDFSDFNKVTKGKPGPLMEKMKNQIKKFGPENVFILTARAKESAPAIHEWLKTQGIKIPLENITGLGNSTGEAKAMWMLEKFAEGYNDMYFVDDAISNVKAVRDVLNQLDIKSKVQQALASKDLNASVNKIMEHSLDIGSEKVFSKAEAKVRGKDIKRRRVFMRDSAADLELLIEPLYGKGKEGIKNKEWFKEEFVMPFERGIRDYNTARQSAKNDYMSLRKQNKDVVKEISKPVEGTAFTNDMAMRVYLWNKAGYKIPDLAKTTEAKLVQHIANNPKLQAYAENFARITKQEKGLKEPGENWWGETMAGEVTNLNRGVSRKQYLQEFIDVKNEIFTEENLNKMESKLGTEWRENITDMFDRMETGRTRSLKMDRGSAIMMNYLNGGIGTIMNFNTRSAVLQTISTTNFLNMRENNPIAAARAMGNVKQFAKDFKYIMNSDMLKQRRDGLAMNVTEAEIASAAASSQNPVQSIISKVLKAGYLPTKMADSFAISFGGATFYRNRIKMYEKQGMKTKEAEKQAFLDFQVIAERTQQSSRADLLSKQQTSLIGRFILPFANTPMQMNRAGMKDILDISKGRYKNSAEVAEKVGRISYYMGAQVAIFAGLQSALFAMLLNDDDVSDEKVANTKSMMLNTTADSMLRGFGVQGAVMSATKNALQEYFKQSAKPGFTADYSEVAEDLLNISPPIGSKFGMLDRAGDRKKWAKIRKNDEFKFELGNPSLEASLMTVQAVTNAPVYSPYQNLFNMKHALSDQYETWQRVLMGAGWTPYSVGVETEDKKKKKSKKKRPKTPDEIIEARRRKFIKSRR